MPHLADRVSAAQQFGRIWSEADINLNDGWPLPRCDGGSARVSRKLLFGPGGDDPTGPSSDSVRSPAHTTLVDPRSRLSARTQTNAKSLILLALPRGLEPLFSP